jgi:hypothetical protein
MGRREGDLKYRAIYRCEGRIRTDRMGKEGIRTKDVRGEAEKPWSLRHP